MAVQITMSEEEYRDLQMCKNNYQKLLDDIIRFTENKTKELEDRYKIKEQNIDDWIQSLDSKKWRIMFAGYSKSQISIWPKEFTRTKVWQIVPKEDITWWLRWKTWIN